MLPSIRLAETPGLSNPPQRLKTATKPANKSVITLGFLTEEINHIYLIDILSKSFIQNHNEIPTQAASYSTSIDGFPIPTNGEGQLMKGKNFSRHFRFRLD
jgi:hypothetical protein